MEQDCEKRHNDELKIAILEEKVRQLERMVWWFIGFVAMQLVGLLILWATRYVK